jgi:hypothetical protein
MTNSTAWGTAPVLRSATQARKPPANSGTSAGRAASPAVVDSSRRRRRSTLTPATTGASSSTRVSLTTTATATSSSASALLHGRDCRRPTDGEAGADEQALRVTEAHSRPRRCWCGSRGPALGRPWNERCTGTA